MNDNIVQFPKHGKKEKTEEISEGLVEAVWVNCLEQLRMGGCDFSDTDKYFPAMALVYESITSLYMLTKNEQHPLQSFAAEALSFQDLEDLTEDQLEELIKEEANLGKEKVHLDGKEMTLDEMFEIVEKERSSSKETVDKSDL